MIINHTFLRLDLSVQLDLNFVLKAFRPVSRGLPHFCIIILTILFLFSVNLIFGSGIIYI